MKNLVDYLITESVDEDYTKALNNLADDTDIKASILKKLISYFLKEMKYIKTMDALSTDLYDKDTDQASYWGMALFGDDFFPVHDFVLDAQEDMDLDFDVDDLEYNVGDFVTLLYVKKIMDMKKCNYKQASLQFAEILRKAKAAYDGDE